MDVSLHFLFPLFPPMFCSVRCANLFYFIDQWENYFSRFTGVAETASTTSNGATAPIAAFPNANSMNGLQYFQGHNRGYPYSATRGRSTA
jgi:hypothetical protein